VASSRAGTTDVVRTAARVSQDESHTIGVRTPTMKGTMSKNAGDGINSNLFCVLEEKRLMRDHFNHKHQEQDKGCLIHRDSVTDSNRLQWLLLIASAAWLYYVIYG